MSNLSVLPKLLKLRSINQIAISNIRQLGNCSNSSGDQPISFDRNKSKSQNSVFEKSFDISFVRKHNRRLIYTQRGLWKSSKEDDAKSVDQFRAEEERIEREFEEQERLKESQRNVDEQAKESTEDHEKIQQVRSDILEASLKFVSSHGWSHEAISHGAESIDYPGVAHGMFPNGAIELIHYFYSKSNRKLIEQLQQELNDSGESSQGGEKIAEKLSPRDFAIRAIRLRLEMILPYKDTWPQALAIMTLPQNVPTSLAQLLTLVDDICYCAGDRSVDIGWYTRRIGIASIYKMVELYLLQDQSPGHQKSWEFLDGRMDEAIHIQEFLNTSDQKTQIMARALGSAFQTARNILGVNCDKR